ncbi:hypothetical protein U1120_02650 [Listeria monocytogenes]
MKKTTMGIIASTISIIGIGCFLTVNTHAENSTISFDEKTKKIDTEKEVSKTEEFELYEEAVENQVTPEEN